MFSIQSFLTLQSKLFMKYKHLSQADRYQIYAHMSSVSDEEIRMIQNGLNNRPRKRLGLKTPAEVFHQSLKRVALRT
jgi:hypothetical protein